METTSKPTHDSRAFDCEYREADGDKPPMLVGYAARFNEWSEDLGWFRERIRPGAFKKALMSSDVRALYNHDSNQLPLGRTPKTLRIEEDSKGLKVEIDLPDTQTARDLMTSIKRGDISQMSFGFAVADAGDEWLEKDGEIKRTITEVKELFDVSPVVFPAYKSTRISVRTAEKVEEIKKNSAETRGVTSEEDKSLREYEQLKEIAEMVENYGGLRKMKRLEQLRAKFAEKRKRSEELRAVDTAAMTPEQATELRSVIVELKSIADDIDAEIQALEIESRNQTTETAASEITISVPDQPIYRGSPASALGQQLLDIRTISRPDVHAASEVTEARSRLDQTEKRNSERFKLQGKESRAASTGGFTVGQQTDGGYFLQGETAIDLMTTGFNNSEVLSRCASRTLAAGTQFVEIYGIDETSRVNGSRSGGVSVYTAAELDAFTASKTKFKKIRIEPAKLTGLYNASGEVMRNVTFLGQEMRQLFGEEFAFKCQDLVINGSGAGEALGILNAQCKIAVAKETGQAAATIMTENILKMESRLWAEGPNVVYLVNRETKPQLSTMSIAIGTGGALVPLYKSDFYQGKRVATLNGLPCITIEQAAALGTAGDIILVDLSQYITANKGDINEAMSIHVNFIYDQETYRFLYYFDGQPRWASAVTPYKGSATVGPILTIAAR